MRSVAGALALIAVLTACGSGGGQSIGSASSSAAQATPPPEVGEAFCDLLDVRAALATDEVGASYHAAQLGELDEAVTVSSEIVPPTLVLMGQALDGIEAWEPGRPFAAHADPLIRKFADATSAFVDSPDQGTFDRADVAGQALRDGLFDGEFARVGVDLFRADCG